MRTTNFRGLAQSISLILSALHFPLLLWPTPSNAAVDIAKGTAQLKTNFQAWGYNDSTNGDLNFRLRRAEIRFEGALAAEAKWFIMIDPAKSMRASDADSLTGDRVLQDVGLVTTLLPGLELTFGQFKAPTTAEGLQPSSQLTFPERSFVARNYGDQREPGVQLSYKLEPLTLRVMASNGEGTNSYDENNSKDLHGRIDLALSDLFEAGAFTTAGDGGYGPDGKARWGANLSWRPQPILVRLEGAYGEDFGRPSHAYVADLAWSITERLQPALRYERGDTGRFDFESWSAGINAELPERSARFKLAYTNLIGFDGNRGTYEPEQGSNGSIVYLMYQMAL